MRSVRAKARSRRPRAAASNNASGAAQPPHNSEALVRLDALQALSAEQLRDEWRRLYRAQPPRLSRDLLIRSLAYRIQELAHGGLNKGTQRVLANLARGMAVKGAITVAAETHVSPGTRLIREWRGKTYAILVLDDGFAFEGKTYLSLTRIAHLITGAHWSGPRFFGLNRKPRSDAAAASEGHAFAPPREAADG